jgi:reactive intermediate/imine deaminase
LVAGRPYGSILQYPELVETAKELPVQLFQIPEMKELGLPFSSAVRVADMVYLSGVLGNLPGTLKLAPGGISGEAKQTMENIGAVLKFCGLGFPDVVKCTIMLAEMSDWAEFNKVYVSYFAPEKLPARSALGCNGLALGARAEVEYIARYP